MSKHRRGEHNARPKSMRGLKRKRVEPEEEAADLKNRVDDFDVSQPESFSDLPISTSTQSGLDASHFKTLTLIQSKAIPKALKGNDILGAAKTGSGKTLAFLVPVLENLHRKNWTDEDGLGALILSPTRELALQIFEVLRKVGCNHTFSAGLVIGGKSLKDERERMGRMNILVATPGRMLQHMDQTSDLETNRLQMLVLDEADRIMDMGFKDTVDAIIEHLPKQRQTLMFSATQTKRVSDLARLSLREPEFVAVHEAADSATPATLQQNYIVTPLSGKLDTLWSFLKSNLKKKILVFLSSGKQVRFVFEALRRMHPGIPLAHLHGRQKLTARLDITAKFARSQYSCLLATDVAARGLDFPLVDWVVQVDAPEDIDTYIHRVGRTARYDREGRAALFLDPSEEEGMLFALSHKNIDVEKVNVREGKLQNTIRGKLQELCFQDPALKYLGQKAFSSYVRSVHLQKDKNVFDVQKLDLQAFAESLGLPGAPKVKFIKGDDAKARKNASRQLAESSSDEDGDSRKSHATGPRTKYDRMFERRNQDVLTDHYMGILDHENGINGDHLGGIAGTDDEQEFLGVKRRFTAGDTALGQNDLDSDDGEEGTSDAKGESTTVKRKKVIKFSDRPGDVLVVDSKRREKLLKSKKKLARHKAPGDHIHFDDEGTPHQKHYYEEERDFVKRGLPEQQRAVFLEREAERTRQADVVDKTVVKDRRREKRDKRKEREREIGSDDEDTGVTLGPSTDAVLAYDEYGTASNIRTESPDHEVPQAATRHRSSNRTKEHVQASSRKQARGDHQTHDLDDLELIASNLLGT